MELSKTPRPARAKRRRAVVRGIEWRPADEVPGGVLPPAVVQRQFDTLRRIDDAQRRARVRSGSYYVG